MEPVEINAGEYYLRAFRTDDRIDDAPAIAEAWADKDTARFLPRMNIDGIAAAKVVIDYHEVGWKYATRVSWAVCDATTAELLAGIMIRDIDTTYGTGEVTCWTQPQHRGKGIMPTALNAALGWVFGGLGLHRVQYRHAEANKASQRIAEKCGFTFEGRLREEQFLDDQRVDMLLWSRLATDPAPEQLR